VFYCVDVVVTGVRYRGSLPEFATVVRYRGSLPVGTSKTSFKDY